MDFYLSQLDILAQNNDLDGLIEILLFVVLAVFWAIAGIVKAKVRESKESKKNQSPRVVPPQPMPARRERGELILEKVLGPSAPVSRNQQRPGSQQSRKNVSYTRPPRQRFPVKPKSEKTPQLKIIDDINIPKFSVPKQTLEPNLQELTPTGTNLKELPEFTSDALKKLKSTRQKVPAESSLAQYMFDFTDTDSLKKAILYYEILGRPLSLRESPNSIDS